MFRLIAAMIKPFYVFLFVVQGVASGGWVPRGAATAIPPNQARGSVENPREGSAPSSFFQ